MRFMYTAAFHTIATQIPYPLPPSLGSNSISH